MTPLDGHAGRTGLAPPPGSTPHSKPRRPLASAPHGQVQGTGSDGGKRRAFSSPCRLLPGGRRVQLSSHLCGRDGGRGGSERHSQWPGCVCPLPEIHGTRHEPLHSAEWPHPGNPLMGAGRLPQLCKSARAVLSLVGARRGAGGNPLLRGGGGAGGCSKPCLRLVLGLIGLACQRRPLGGAPQARVCGAGT